MSSFLNIPDTTTACPEYPPTDPAISYTFPLDPFQQWAVAAIHRNENVMVTAKTGSGKTLVGEYQIAYTLRAGGRIFYTTPIKSLSNQKFHDLKHQFPDASVGILTGDIKCNPDAQIIVMTTEILRNLLFKQETTTASLGTAGVVSMDGLGAVIFDEVHYINDPDRGHVWEECLILMPPTICMILLSATIDSPEALAGWLGEIKQVRMHLLKTSYRIVPLTHALYAEGEGLTSSLILKDRDEAPANVEVYRAWLRSRSAVKDGADAWKKTVVTAKRAGESAGGREGKVKLKSFTHQLNECVETLGRKDLLPALFFVFSRQDCEKYAEKISGSLLNSSETADVKHILSFHLHKYSDVLEKLPQYHQLTRLLERGIAFHHSGVLPLLKEAVELLFVRGFIRVLFATETFAVGLNMPTRTVVFTSLEKPADGGGFRPLRYDEYAQMAGRAGRRGKDTRGYVFYLPAREPLSADNLRDVMSGSLVGLQSRIQFHYDFVLKAIHLNATATATPVNEASGSGSGNSSEPIWMKILNRSYWAVQRQAALTQLEKAKEDAKQALAAQKAKLTADQQAAFVEKVTLEQTVRTQQNSKKRAAQAALRRWEDEHDGPTWTYAAKLWETQRILEASVVAATAACGEVAEFGPDERLQPVLGALRAWGYLGSDSDKDQRMCLTSRGVLATEVNEGNPFLMTELYLSVILKAASATEIVATLGFMLADREALERGELCNSRKLSECQTSAQKLLQDLAKKGRQMDERFDVRSCEEFWSVGIFWVEVLGRWLAGEEAGVLIADYNIYEGNLMKGLLKIANLLNEWISLATFCGDVEMLDKLQDVPNMLLRGIAQPESLYLRL